MVLLNTKNLKLKVSGTKKLCPKFVGPFKVIKRVGEVAYRLVLPPNIKVHSVFHVNLLHEYRSNGTVQPPPPPIEIEGDLEYEVEQVILHRDTPIGRKRSKREYLIKWLGYGPEHNSWEPATNMHCDELISEYWNAVQNAQLAREQRHDSCRALHNHCSNT